MPQTTPTVICVDDEPMVLDSLREQFERQFGDELDVEVAQDAAEALELVDELVEAGVDVPVVISDHIMPGMKGDELLVRLKDILPDARKILLTGQAGLEAVGRAVNEAGLYRYIAKPWDRADLALTVRGAVEGYQTEMTVRQQRERLTRSHDAALRFVPHPYLQLLGRADLTEVERGDCAEMDIGIYYSDIRSFTPLVEARAPRDNLGWINDYLAQMDAPIQAHNGFIDDITGDALLAIFPGGADDLVKAGIASLRQLAELNARRAGAGDPPLRIGLGQSFGRVLMGVFGGVRSLRAGVISDSLNLAARVEGLTRHLGTHLITGTVRDRLDDPDAFALRYVGRVRVKGRSQQTDLFEVLDGLPEAERDRKRETAATLGAAVAAYQAGDLAGARDGFARLGPADPVARWYAGHIDRLQAAGIPADFDGTTRLDRK